MLVAKELKEMNFDKSQLGNAIRVNRLALGYTQEYLAEQVDITVTHMKHIESGHRLPSVEVLCQLVQVLHLSLDNLWLQTNSGKSIVEKKLALRLSHCSETDLLIISDLAISLIKNRN